MKACKGRIVTPSIVCDLRLKGLYVFSTHTL